MPVSWKRRLVAALLGLALLSPAGAAAKIERFKDPEGTLHISNAGEEPVKPGGVTAPATPAAPGPAPQPLPHPGSPPATLPAPAPPPVPPPPPQGQAIQPPDEAQEVPPAPEPLPAIEPQFQPGEPEPEAGKAGSGPRLAEIGRSGPQRMTV